MLGFAGVTEIDERVLGGVLGLELQAGMTEAAMVRAKAAPTLNAEPERQSISTSLLAELACEPTRNPEESTR